MNQRHSQYTFQDLQASEVSARFEEEQHAQIQKNCEMLSYLKELQESMQREERHGVSFLQEVMRPEGKSARVHVQGGETSHERGYTHAYASGPNQFGTRHASDPVLVSDASS